jgi:TatA/E family protein of Tat protein translocase
VFNVGPMELMVILILALIVFGPARLPEIGRTVGKSLREFRRATDEIKDELQLHLDDDEEPKASAASSRSSLSHPSTAAGGNGTGSEGTAPASAPGESSSADPQDSDGHPANP